MPVPSGIENVSTTPSSNNPPGTESPTAGDDYLRTYAAFIKQLVSKGSDIASASTITPPSTASVFAITGTTTITTIGNTNSWLGREVTFMFTGACQITHSSSLIMPGAANYTTTAGDILKFVQDTTGVWRCSSLQRVSSRPALPSEIQANTYTYFTTAGTGAAYTLTPTPPITAYTAGQSFLVNFHVASTASTPTLAISGVATPPTLLRYGPGGYASIQAGDIPGGLVSRVTLLSATQAVVESIPPTRALRGVYSGLAIINNNANPNSQIDISYDSILLASITAAGVVPAYAGSLTANIAASGVNGLDTGSEAISTWYYAYVISNGSTTASLLSASATSPTLPAGYVYSQRVGAIYNDASSNFIKILQADNYVRAYNATAVTSTVPPTSYTSLSLAAFVPTTARSVDLVNDWQYGASATGVEFYAPTAASDYAIQFNRATGGSTSVRTGNEFRVPITTAQTVYYQRTGTAASGGSLYCSGWYY